MDEANEQPQWYKHPTDSMLEVQDDAARSEPEQPQKPKILTAADIERIAREAARHKCGRDCDCNCGRYYNARWEWIIGPDPRWARDCKCVPRAAKAEPGSSVSYVSDIRPNPGNEKGATCEICGAMLVCLNCSRNHREPAQPQGEMQEDKDIIEVLTARDNAEEWGGTLAVAISEHFRVPVGEHSSCNDPRQIALEILSGGYKTDSDADRELAALRKNAGDYQELLTENERLRAALKAAVRFAAEMRDHLYLHSDAARCRDMAKEFLSLPAVRELEGK